MNVTDTSRSLIGRAASRVRSGLGRMAGLRRRATRAGWKLPLLAVVLAGMVAFDAWHEQGFGAVAKTYLERLPRESGLRRSIDDHGDLLVSHMVKPEPQRFALLPRLNTPTWFDPATKAPRL